MVTSEKIGERENGYLVFIVNQALSTNTKITKRSQ
jgi:hypothetical protein